MSDIISFEPVRAWDRDGIATPGALAYFYLSGTTTPQIVYTTEALDVAHPVPLEADANGVFPPVFSAVALRCTVTDSAGVTLPGFPIDPVARIPTGSGAAEITFEATGDIPATNVQAAIERVQANLVAPLLAGGIGVTGNADVLANIDATNTPSGAYRFDGTTTGTLPAGVTGSAGGTVKLWRETATEAIMQLSPRGSTTTWQRTLTSGAWGAWSGTVTSNGAGMTANLVRIGSNGANALLAQVDSTALGVVHTSGLSAGGTGTYCFARSATETSTTFGDTRAGSDLVTTSAAYRTVAVSSGSGSNSLNSGAALSGTWRCMGTHDARNVVAGVSELWGATLWLRIA